MLPHWLFGGKLDGYEFKALNPTRSDSKVGSFSINVRTGAWADFATGDKGGDLISLYAYLQGIDQLKAAKEVAAIVGVEISEHIDSAPDGSKKEPAKLKVDRSSAIVTGYSDTHRQGVDDAGLFTQRKENKRDQPILVSAAGYSGRNWGQYAGR